MNTFTIGKEKSQNFVVFLIVAGFQLNDTCFVVAIAAMKIYRSPLHVLLFSCFNSTKYLLNR